MKEAFVLLALVFNVLNPENSSVSIFKITKLRLLTGVKLVLDMWGTIAAFPCKGRSGQTRLR